MRNKFGYVHLKLLTHPQLTNTHIKEGHEEEEDNTENSEVA